MNVLIVSDFQVYPPINGAGIAQFGVLEPLSKKCNISVLFHQHFTPSEKELGELRHLLPNIKFYTLGDSVKKTQSKKLFNTLKGSINTLKKLALHAKDFVKNSFIDNSFESGKDFDGNLVKFHTFLYPPNSKKKIDKVLEIIKNDEIDIIQLDFESNLNLVSLIPDNIKKVYGCYDCQFYRVDSFIEAGLTQSEYARYVREYIKTLEISFLRQYDVVIANTEPEAAALDNALNAQGEKDKVVLAPYPVLDKDFIELNRNQFYRPDKLLFVGTEYHFPNKDGVNWFLEEIAPTIFKKFGLRLHVVGSWSQETKQRYKDHPSQVVFTGFVDDLSSLIKSSIYISPMRLCGGLRAKILTAMAQGMPVIAHPQSLIGNSAKHMESVMIADDVSSFCFAVDYLLADLERTFTLCKNAQELMRTSYSQSFAAEKRFHIYEKLLK
ncbi:MAG TPA: glycosyltransferase family 4 protein [Leptolyngbyaceae cyanobacterium M33_DOE_097]|uniref:Glycosyltransferase n=1 Tax=Oscillatoriales cyanobacterium SpSt-418 TaxID=2282169 RepID=A0A7C3KIF6_9CYAN|nr:glycosyltransferase family 4 protein [Leptolyngbyaceae cyanobacterium M33_DOE_097]